MKALLCNFKDYEKNRKDLFVVLKDRLEIAKSNSKKALREAEGVGDFNPSTKVHMLIEVLQSQITES